MLRKEVKGITFKLPMLVLSCPSIFLGFSQTTLTDTMSDRSKTHSYRIWKWPENEASPIACVGKCFVTYFDQMQVGTVDTRLHFSHDSDETLTRLSACYSPDLVLPLQHHSLQLFFL